jgi:hypothetical protein
LEHGSADRGKRNLAKNVIPAPDFRVILSGSLDHPGGVGLNFWQMPDYAGHEISGRKRAAKAASETTEDARDQRLG